MKRIYTTVILDESDFSDIDSEFCGFYKSYEEAKASYVEVIERILFRLNEEDEKSKTMKVDVDAIKANRDVVPLHFQFSNGNIFQLWICDIPNNEKERGDG